MANKYNEAFVPVMNDLMLGMEHVEAGKMFGLPGYMVKGKLAVGFYKEGVIAKVGQEKAQALIASGSAQVYEPQAGRVWKDWVLVTPAKPEALRTHVDLFKAAVGYVFDTN